MSKIRRAFAQYNRKLDQIRRLRKRSPEYTHSFGWLAEMQAGDDNFSLSRIRRLKRLEAKKRGWERKL